MQGELLDPPVLSFSGVDLILADAVHLVYPVELSDFLSHRAKPADHVPVEIVFVNLATGIRAVKKLLAIRIRW